jgi:hypothetical protein
MASVSVVSLNNGENSVHTTPSQDIPESDNSGAAMTTTTKVEEEEVGASMSTPKDKNEESTKAFNSETTNTMVDSLPVTPCHSDTKRSAECSSPDSVIDVPEKTPSEEEEVVVPVVVVVDNTTTTTTTDIDAPTKLEDDSSVGGDDFQDAQTSSRRVKFADESGLALTQVRVLEPVSVRRVVLLMMSPDDRTFEFLHAEYPLNNSTTVQVLMEQLPKLATNPVFQRQEFYCLSKTKSNDQLPKSWSLQDCDLEDSELLLGVLQGYSVPEMAAFALPLLVNGKIIKAVNHAKRTGRGLKSIQSGDEWKNRKPLTEESASVEVELWAPAIPSIDSDEEARTPVTVTEEGVSVEVELEDKDDETIMDADEESQSEDRKDDNAVLDYSRTERDTEPTVTKNDKQDVEETTNTTAKQETVNAEDATKSRDAKDGPAVLDDTRAKNALNAEEENGTEIAKETVRADSEVVEKDGENPVGGDDDTDKHDAQAENAVLGDTTAPSGIETVTKEEIYYVDNEDVPEIAKDTDQDEPASLEEKSEDLVTGNTPAEEQVREGTDGASERIDDDSGVSSTTEDDCSVVSDTSIPDMDNPKASDWQYPELRDYLGGDDGAEQVVFIIHAISVAAAGWFCSMA